MGDFDPKAFSVPRARARVLVVGAGGLGAPAIYALAGSGLATIGVADGDTIDVSNLQRQIIHRTADAGRLKTGSAAAFLSQAGFAGTVERFDVRLDAENILEVVSTFDAVIDASDTFRSKFMINDACVLTGRPLVHAGVLQFDGQLMTIYPERSACLRCLFDAPPPPDSVPTCQEAGILGAAAGVLGAIQAAEALKVIDGHPGTIRDRVLSFNARYMAFRTVPIYRDPSCPVCGETPRINTIAGENYPAAACT